MILVAMSKKFLNSWSMQLYREEGEKNLARLAFDCSRSIDPSLSLPWAGMSADSQIRQVPKLYSIKCMV